MDQTTTEAMTTPYQSYDQERLNDALHELENVQERAEVLEHHLKEATALIAKQQRLVMCLMGVMLFVAGLLAAGMIWGL